MWQKLPAGVSAACSSSITLNLLLCCPVRQSGDLLLPHLEASHLAAGRTADAPPKQSCGLYPFAASKVQVNLEANLPFPCTHIVLRSQTYTGQGASL